MSSRKRAVLAGGSSALILAVALAAAPSAASASVVSPSSQSGPAYNIVGGTPAAAGAYPFMASIQDDKGHHVCGGTLVAPSVIMTAAHCVGGQRIVPELAHQVRVGVTDLTDPVQGIQRGVASIVRHPLFDFPAAHDDLAFLLLDSPVTTVLPEPLPPEDDSTPPAGQLGIALGWGQTSPTFDEQPRQRSAHLMKAGLPFHLSTECTDGQPAGGPQGDTADGVLCAGGIPGVGICHGDSGGPLLYDGMQVGIVSLGANPCGSDLDVFTKLSSTRLWNTLHLSPEGDAVAKILNR
ncbi:S1 family peptidase [Leifsonia sp. NPDC102414]|uniref:S1 family peptidase n=1 Tax=Leifsonia sp. NPDC102414 TaxID=3364124 RepID=UPI00382086D8